MLSSFNFTKKKIYFTLLFLIVFFFGFFQIDASEKYIQILSPNNGEELQLERTSEIKWQSQGVERVGIILYKGGKITGVIARNIPAENSKIHWTPGFDLEEGKDYKIGIYQYPWSKSKPIDYSDNFFTLQRGITSPIFENYFLLGASPNRISPEAILHFNPIQNSGWIYIAQTVPENGLAFWAAMIKSLSTQTIDNSAQLLYGITDVDNGKYYSGFLDGGSFSEESDEVNVFYQKDNKKILEFRQKKSDLSEFELKVNLPWDNNFYQMTKTLTFKRPILYESGDGIIPMTQGINSLYTSMVAKEGFWIDFQKFNISSPFSIFPKTNHRWMSFVLDKPIGLLPTGTIGVGWEILNDDNQRQPGGYTNIDLLIPGHPQITATETQINQVKIKEINYWNSGHQTYLKKWQISYPGISLLFETLIPDQENKIMSNYFYEGMIKVLNPLTGEQIGTGMLEQTHNEATD